jgi:Spy/CpxP family protein refolding chaperone
MKKLFFLSLLLSFAVSLAAAQNQNDPSTAPQGQPHPHMGMGGFPGMPGIPGLGRDWWRNSEIAQQINLDESQKQQLSEIFSSHRGNLVQLRESVETDESKLRALLEQDAPQQAVILGQLGKLQADRNALETEFTVMSLAFRGVLHPDQWKQLRALARQRMMDFKMRRSEHGPSANGPLPPQQ